MNIKEVFDRAETDTLTYDQFVALSEGAKFADLSEGNYVSKQKYTDDLAARDTRINDLTTTIGNRDSDLSKLQQQLQEAGEDVTKLGEVNTKFTELQNKYDRDTKNYQKQLQEQAYSFAVKEFANSKKFSSNAAKRDFITSMMNKKLQMENDKIIGAEDFVSMYSADNEDAFVVESEPEPSKPQFVAPTGTSQSEPADVTGGFGQAFHFNYVHPKKD